MNGENFKKKKKKKDNLLFCFGDVQIDDDDKRKGNCVRLRHYSIFFLRKKIIDTIDIFFVLSRIKIRILRTGPNHYHLLFIICIQDY